MSEPVFARVDPHRCPLCGGPNNCAVAIDPDAPDCWCSRTRVPDELRAQVPEAARDVACVCARCVAAANQPHQPPG